MSILSVVFRLKLPNTIMLIVPQFGVMVQRVSFVQRILDSLCLALGVSNIRPVGYFLSDRPVHADVRAGH